MIGICPICKLKRPIGRCDFAAGKADVTEHCRSCCTPADRPAWKEIKAGRPGKPKASALRRGPGLTKAPGLRGVN
jgi:hypothetical protein